MEDYNACNGAFGIFICVCLPILLFLVIFPVLIFFGWRRVIKQGEAADAARAQLDTPPTSDYLRVCRARRTAIIMEDIALSRGADDDDKTLVNA
jgi:hypothetical protein